MTHRDPHQRRSRREFLNDCAAGLIVCGAASAVGWTGDVSAPSRSRIRGLLIGGVLGDALGGPVEFQQGPNIDGALPNLRQWSPERRLTEQDLRQLAASLPLHSYEKLRPGVEPYGQWRELAPAGTTTDDTRHKIVLLRTLRHALAAERFPISAREVARQYLDFTPHAGKGSSDTMDQLNDEGFREYRYAARWLLGDRDLTSARPLERLWAGEPNCSGQMLLPPLAAAFPGDPAAAYLAAYALDFVDGPGARDLAAALVAGLAAVLAPDLDSQPASVRWEQLLDVMQRTDPYRYADVPFTGRPLQRWLQTARGFAESAEGRPAKLFEQLEEQGRAVYWWDAHFTLLAPIAVLHFCNFDPLAALHVMLDFRHDSDSYAQVLAAMIGAVHGEDIFPEQFRATVEQRLQADYGESCAEWEQVLSRCAQRHARGDRLVEAHDPA